jgi:hypothetical protein
VAGAPHPWRRCRCPSPMALRLGRRAANGLCKGIKALGRRLHLSDPSTYTLSQRPPAVKVGSPVGCASRVCTPSQRRCTLPPREDRARAMGWRPGAHDRYGMTRVGRGNGCQVSRSRGKSLSKDATSGHRLGGDCHCPRALGPRHTSPTRGQPWGEQAGRGVRRLWH